MPKSTKRFILSTSQLNSHGFRSLTDGADLTDFIANPIMYWLHVAPEGKTNEEVMPIGFWEDIQKEGDEITAVPNFNDTTLAKTVYDLVEHGTLRAASVEVEPVEVDTNKKNWLAGQKLPTVTKWRIGEASIVDRGSNKGAIAKLKHAGRVVALSEDSDAANFFTSLQQQEPMKIKLNKKASVALKLAEGTELDATEIVEKLMDVLDERDGTLKLREDKVISLESDIKKLEEAADENKIVLMVDKAITDRKILAGAREKFITLAKADYDTTASLLNDMPGTASVQSRITGAAEGNSDELAALNKQSFDDLLKNGGADKLRKLDPESYKLKYKQKFGKEPARV